jgi:cytochrome c oxidase cbb3-type subunit III
MADFTSGFWSAYIAILTTLGIAFCLFVLVANSRKPAASADNTTGHVWDEDLREANNPLPRWWIGLFILTIVFAIAYLIYYPGLGAFSGAGGWSSAAAYRAERAALEQATEPIFAGFSGRSSEQLVGDPQAMAIGERLFLNNCAQCHGSDGRGSRGFPNLTDRDWLYGGSERAIRTSITEGRHGIMPALGAAIGGAASVERLAQYVLSLSGSATDAMKAELGRQHFGACAACHGPKGEGNQALGAPDLTDRTWLHAPGLAGVIATINNGRENMMPEHGSKLTANQIHVLTGYVMALSRPATRPAVPAEPEAPKAPAAPSSASAAPYQPATLDSVTLRQEAGSD